MQLRNQKHIEYGEHSTVESEDFLIVFSIFSGAQRRILKFNSFTFGKRCQKVASSRWIFWKSPSLPFSWLPWFQVFFFCFCWCWMLFLSLIIQFMDFFHLRIRYLFCRAFTFTLINFVFLVVVFLNNFLKKK